MQTCATTGVYDACQCDERDSGPDRASDGGAQSGSDDHDGSTNTGSTDAGPDVETSEPGGPKFLAFGTNVAQVTDGESITFTAVLTDPDGIENLIGGNLTSENGSISYGAFATSGEEGAYALTLTWAAIHQSQPLTFVDETSLTFKAVFYDVDGHEATRTKTVRLHCDKVEASRRGACDGACKSLESATDCGACDASCGTGTCVSDGACAKVLNEGVYSDTIGSCASACNTLNSASTCSAANLSFPLGLSGTTTCSATSALKSFQLKYASIGCRCTSPAYVISLESASDCKARCDDVSGGCNYTEAEVQRPNDPASPIYEIEDACDGPYRYANWEALGVGTTQAINLRATSRACTCEFEPAAN